MLLRNTPKHSGGHAPCMAAPNHPLATAQRPA